MSKQLRWFLLLCGYLLVLMLAASAAQHWNYRQLTLKAQHQSDNLAAFIRYEIGRYADLPEQIANSGLLQSLLLELPDSKDQLNQYLFQLQRSADVADLYLVNPSGIVIASSNAHGRIYYLGRDFGFRPYVQDALAGQNAQYYALGHTCERRGYYYSVPVRIQGQILAVMVAKVDLEPIEQHQQQIAGLADSHFMVTGQSDEVFLSSVAEWRLTSLSGKALSPPEQQRYITQAIQPMDYAVRSAMLASGYPLWQLKIDGKAASFLPYQRALPEFGWTLTVLASPASHRSSLWWAFLLVTLFYSSALLAFWVRRERQKRHLQLVQHNQQLEQRVIARTKDLAETNSQLIRQIERREQTETELAQTEQQLVQTAKLATIGALSASLNHELNQPLTALQSYAQTTEKLIDKGYLIDAKTNIQAMRQLMQRLSVIVAQFKDFSRKSSGKNQLVQVNKLILDALGIVKHQCQQQGVKIRLQLPDLSPTVLADPIQLEQVLVNILTNGVQAMTGVVDATFHIVVKTQQQQVSIHIRDQGPGIEPHHLERIFEAFFTTKQRDGLGLGLSISQRIVQSFGGQLEVRNAPTAGAEFIISLAIAKTGS
ncbi:sensor histidine kinase [Rheinheimera soli]|uniref:sensor histidine kinase n=1 Tax=Rheinheimera soli TaxID=443616 RepID=UPI001E4A628E|nr:ATP-binding protein [Rheinheimera soli]